MSIDFEQEKREELDGANDAKKLSDQVVKLQELEAELLVKEQEYKEMKRKVELVSAEVIPTMMQEMNISTLKLSDGTSVEVKPVYGASIPADKKEEAYKWLRENGLGDLIKNEEIFISCIIVGITSADTSSTFLFISLYSCSLTKSSASSSCSFTT